jgi:formamidopyrimidine-DNA glycosylase
MPELAEVEYFRKQWDDGVGQKVQEAMIHHGKRVFRGTDTHAMAEALKGAKLVGSEAQGKQMLFHFSGGAWVGIHLGMSGVLRCEQRNGKRRQFEPGKHDHLALVQARRVLVFHDPRMFGRIRFHEGRLKPEWWTTLPPAVTDEAFTQAHLDSLLRGRRAPIKAVLLDQAAFPGVGNWMADEILWQSELHPARAAESLTKAERQGLRSKARFVCRTSMKTIGIDWGDPPKGWLIHVRWKAGGYCPKHGIELKRGTIAGRTTAWCERCQRSDRLTGRR